MLTSIYNEDIKYWNINEILDREGDIEIQDEEDDEDEENLDETRKSLTPEPEKDIYREEDETPSIAECF